MFTAKCFIKKNTPELLAKLEQMGYVQALHKEDYNTIGLSVDQGDIFPLRIDDIPILTKELFIDCGDNTNMFLAIAALRDDTDKYQWFYSTGWTDFEGNPLPDKWVFCDQDTLEHFAWVNNSPNSYKTGWKKATVKELIEHFK